MKTLIKRILLIVGIGIAYAATVAADNPPTKPFDREQTKGFVRVVLIKVDRTTVFTDKGFRNEKNHDIHAVPSLDVVYVVEALGDEPVTNRLSSDSSAFVNKTNLSHSVPGNLAGGGGSVVNEYRIYPWGASEKKPEVQDPKRAVVYKDWHRGFRVPNGNFDLHITTGFNGHKEKFVFEGVPLE